VNKGIVLWPDEATSELVRQIWRLLATEGLPSLATHTHRRHRPHVSLFVADNLPVRPALDAIGLVPPRPIRLRIESAGVFPGGILFLAVAMNQALLDEHRRVHEVIEPYAIGPWSQYAPGTWTPHVTLARGLNRAQLAEAIPLVLDRLPIEGRLDAGGIDDGDSGQYWISSDEIRGGWDGQVGR
jgi:2'-5' RNA ligase